VTEKLGQNQKSGPIKFTHCAQYFGLYADPSDIGKNAHYGLA